MLSHSQVLMTTKWQDQLREMRGREKLCIVIHTASPDNKWVSCICHWCMSTSTLHFSPRIYKCRMTHVTFIHCVCLSCRLTGVERPGQSLNSLLWSMNEQMCAAERCCVVGMWWLQGSAHEHWRQNLSEKVKWIKIIITIIIKLRFVDVLS